MVVKRQPLAQCNWASDLFSRRGEHALTDNPTQPGALAPSAPLVPPAHTALPWHQKWRELARRLLYRRQKANAKSEYLVSAQPPAPRSKAPASALLLAWAFGLGVGLGLGVLGSVAWLAWLSNSSHALAAPAAAHVLAARTSPRAVAASEQMAQQLAQQCADLSGLVGSRPLQIGRAHV